jgi:multidrug resistance efflux pump
VSEKATCPACNAHLSGVYDALIGTKPACPSCGLAGDALREIEHARKRHADAELTAQLEAAVIRYGKAEAELKKLRARLRGIRQEFADWERAEPVSLPEWDYAQMDYEP